MNKQTAEKIDRVVSRVAVSTIYRLTALIVLGCLVWMIAFAIVNPALANEHKAFVIACSLAGAGLAWLPWRKRGDKKR